MASVIFHTHYHVIITLQTGWREPYPATML
jgi:hypothetical protein